jgi:hypothetical protein
MATHLTNLQWGHSMIANTEREPTYDKIGGFLSLLIIGLMYLSPLYILGGTFEGFDKIERSNPGVLTLAAWGTFKIVCWIIAAASIYLSVSAGRRLKKVHTISSVSYAVNVLWAIGPGAVLAGMFAAMLIFNNSNGLSDTIPVLIKSVMIAGIWNLYLSKSKRVKTIYTYGEAPVESVIPES